MNVHTPLRFLSAVFLSLCLAVASIFVCRASDTLHIKQIKPYIRPCIYFNHYGTPQRRDPSMKQYRFTQDDIGFYLPLFTHTWFNEDDVTLSSLHLLMTMDMIRYRPQLTYLNESYSIGRLSTGVRLFYGTGNKSVFYFTFAPFVSQEFQYTERKVPRLTFVALYSRTVSKNFAYRFGLSRTYTYGTALILPVIGIRVGSVDKLHLNVQFPRNISMDLPMGKRTWFSLFSRRMGGIYNVRLQDSLLGPKGTLAVLRRFELLNGVQFSFRTGEHFSFYVSTGFVTRRTVSFSLNEDENHPLANYRDRKVEKIPASIFFGLGLSVRFGKAKKVYNNTTMYDVFDLNNMYRSGSETGPMDNDVPASADKYKVESLKELKYKDVEDLVTDDY